MRRERYGIILLAVLLWLAGGALGHSAGTAPVTAEIGADGIQRVDVLAGSYFFNPNRIVLKVNVPAQIRVKKDSGLVPHDITMKSPEAGMQFQVGLGSEPKTIAFTPIKTGTYPFYCSKKFLGESHREKGMEGTIEVVP